MLTKTKNSIFITGLFLVLLILPNFANAQQQIPETEENSLGGSCQSKGASVDGAQDVKKGTYSVYVRLAKADQQETVTLRAGSLFGSNCSDVGKAKAYGNKWAKIGIFKLANSDYVNFSLETSSHQGLPGANRPEILLVTAKNPVCVPAADCKVTINGLQGVVSASSDNNLRIINPIKPELDTLKQVDYYVDSRHAYTADSISDFDTRYIPSFEHVLSTVATYESGQQITFTEKIDRGYNDALNYYAFTIYEKNKTVINTGIALLAAVMIANGIFYVLRKVLLKKQWRKTHVAAKQKLPTKFDYKNSKPTPSLHITQANQYLDYARRFRKIGFYGMIGLISLIIINSYIMQPFTVDGISMQNTLQSGQSLLINKSGKLYASASRQQYLPKRGEVIVFEKTKTDFLDAQESKRYFVKRVIGLPGERIVVKNSKITVFNADVEISPDSDKPWSQDIIKSDLDDIDITLGADELFVVGDNRPGSIDSRYYGAIKANQIIGNVVARTLPKPRLF